MQNRNTHKVAFITGAGRRVGAAIVRHFHEHGLNVLLHCHQSHQEAEALCAALNALRPHSAAVLQADLTNIAAISDLIQAAVTVFGRLDILVNNASGFYATPLGNITESAWQDLMTTNAEAPLFLAQAAMPHLQATHGSIINIGDVYGERPKPDYLAYSISKAALLMVTKALAVAAGPNVRVNTVSPGSVMWPEGENALSDKGKADVLECIALKRVGSPEAIAKTVLHVALYADYMTGHNVVVDGGRSLLI